MPTIRLLSVLSTIGLVTFSACATGATPLLDPHDSAPRAQVQLDFTAPATDGAVGASFPAVVEPRLPSADRIAPRIRTLLGETASADVHLCVAPAGNVTSVALARGSTMPAFDHAMMNDVTAWQFAAQPGPATVRTCERFTISYRTHR